MGYLSRRAGQALLRFVTYAVLILGGLMFTFPFLWMVRTSLMEETLIYVQPPVWIPWPLRIQNYREMLAAGPVSSWVKNSAIVTTLSVTGDLFASTLAAFGFSRTKFPGRDKLFVMVLATLMIPFHVLLIPQFAFFHLLHWINTLRPLWVPMWFGTAFSIFVLRQYFLTLPTELDEAAVIDGATKWDIFLRIVIPLSKPAIATVGVFRFIDAWNDFVRPLVFLQTPDALTLAVGIRWFSGRYETFFHWLMAGSVVMLLPIIITFFIAQKQFVRGIVLTGIKG